MAASKSRTPVLDNYAKDISKEAADGRIEPVLYRKREVETLKQYISKRKNNNVVLVGKSGVGKTSIVYGMAERLITDNTSGFLRNYQIQELNIAKLYAGSTQLGKLEERVMAIINEIIDAPNTILFIEDIGSIFRGNSSSSIGGEQFNLFNILRPYLMHGQLRCICCSTAEKLLNYKSKYPSLERIFQVLMVEELKEESILGILEYIKPRYESFHNVIFSDDAIEACYELSKLYIENGAFPDKAIDLMDEVGVNIKYTNAHVPEHIEKLEKEIEELKEKKIQAVRNQQYEKAADTRDEESKLVRELEYAKIEWEEESRTQRYPVDSESVEEIVHKKTKISLEEIKSRIVNSVFGEEVEDEQYYKAKFEEHKLGKKTSIKIGGIPDEMLTSLQQYILYFREYISQVKGEKLAFDVAIVEQGLRLDFISDQIEDFQLIQDWFNEYLDLFRNRKDTLFLNFEREVDEATSNVVMAEIKNQIRFLESQIEVIQLKMNHKNLEKASITPLALNLPAEYTYLMNKGYANVNDFRISLKEEIGEGSIEAVILEIIQFFKSTDEDSDSKELMDEVILVNARYSSLKLKASSELIGEKDQRVEMTKVNRSLLEIINRIK